MSTLSLNDHPVCLAHPERWSPPHCPSAWIEHVPFGMFLMSLLRPRVLVELGTHYGVSYCAFCQAINDLGINCSCFAVDTWQGDSQAGSEGPEVLVDLREHHDRRYSSFSRLLQRTFEDALTTFESGSIDILHIDGFHSYEAVSHDFATWLPMMSDRGVILFHDTHERSPGFGVWKLWEELRPRYPSFDFHHGHGLGVLAVGADSRQTGAGLFDLSKSEADRLRRSFCEMGWRLGEIQRLSTALWVKNEEVRALEARWQGTWDRRAYNFIRRLARPIRAAFRSNASSEIPVS